jgi:PucR-like helix-turn-helix protein/diguanylate cyclase with GGDEF domain
MAPNPLESSLPRMDGERARRQVAEVAEALCARIDELATAVAHAITREVSLYQATDPVPFELVVHGCATNIRSLLNAMSAGTEFDPAAATSLGIERARDGVPLAAVMEAYRVGFRALWDAAVKEVAGRPQMNGEAVQLLTTKIFAAQDIFTAAMTAAYRDEQTRRVVVDESEREVLIDSVLHGRLFEQWSIWEAADCLRLPAQGPYVVIAAESNVGAEALPGVESKLRSMDVFSAWQQLPDMEVGIVHVKSDKQLANVLALVSRMASNRVGVSAQFDDLRDTAQALRYARVTLRGRSDQGPRVTQFDGSILSTAAVSAPEVMMKLAVPIIECFAELGTDERDVLFETFRVWLENDGSLRAVGELLFCHPNTVRYRLHRIEQRTGRSVTRPRDVAELSLAFEVHRLLM